MYLCPPSPGAHRYITLKARAVYEAIKYIIYMHHFCFIFFIRNVKCLPVEALNKYKLYFVVHHVLFVL